MSKTASKPWTGYNLENLTSFLERESDYTVRLLNKAEPRLKSVIYGVLWLHGYTDSWKVHLLAPKNQTESLSEKASFNEATEIFVEQVQSYLGKGYKLTVMEMGYSVPPGF